MSEQGMKSKYRIGQAVDLAAPTVLIVGVTFHGNGPGQPFTTSYDVLEGSQIHRDVKEEAILGFNEVATREYEAEWAKRDAAAAAANDGPPKTALGNGISRGLHAVSDPVNVEGPIAGQERRQENLEVAFERRGTTEQDNGA